jgi:hypothetical protein
MCSAYYLANHLFAAHSALPPMSAPVDSNSELRARGVRLQRQAKPSSLLLDGNLALDDELDNTELAPDPSSTRRRGKKRKRSEEVLPDAATALEEARRHAVRRAWLAYLSHDVFDGISIADSVSAAHLYCSECVSAAAVRPVRTRPQRPHQDVSYRPFRMAACCCAST